MEVFKYSPDVVLEILMLIFNESLKEKEIPSEPKPTYVSSLCKKGNNHECTSYRGLNVQVPAGRLYG